jgi:TonB family protein
MNIASVNLHAAELAGGGPAAAPKPRPEERGAGGPASPKLQCAGGWPLSRWLMLIALVFVAHVALIFTFGERKPDAPRAVTNAPELKLTTSSSEWLALNDPTLFAQPNLAGFAGPAWLEPPRVEFHRQEWTEPPRWLLLPVEELGAIFGQFMQTNHFAIFQFELKPPARFIVPVALVEPNLPQTSTLRIEGDLTQRQLLTPISLESWPNDDILKPSVVQALVDAKGNVTSIVLLSSSGLEAANQRALELVRAARFTPSPGLTIGQFVFNWHTVAPPVTNAPSGS